MTATNFASLPAVVAAVRAANGIDKAIDKAAAIKQTFTVEALAALKAGTLTLETLRGEMVQAHRDTLPSRKAMMAVSSLNDCNGTWKSWFYDTKAIFDAGAADRVIGGEAATSVRRNMNAKPAAPKVAGDAAPAVKLPSLSSALAAINAAIAMALADNKLAVELAGNADLATLIANVGKLTAKVEAIAAAPIAKAA